MSRRLFSRFATVLLVATILSMDATWSAMAAPSAEAVHGERLAQRSGGSRASIRRSPSRRALKVVSVGAGGGGGVAVECDELSSWMAEGEIPGSGGSVPQSAHRIVYPHTSTATVSGYVLVMLTQTFICVEPAIPATGAVAVYAMDGAELPAAMAESSAELSVVAMPAAAYLQPGYWLLVANDGEHVTMTGVWVPELEGPTAVYDGDSVLLAGFQPNERVAIAWFDYDTTTQPESVLDVEELAKQEGMTVEDLLMMSTVFSASHVATLQVDDQGALLIDWPEDFLQDFVVAGEETPELVTSWYGSTSVGDSVDDDFQLDYATLAAAAETEAGGDGFAPGDRVRNISSGLIMVRRTPGYVDKPGGDVVRRVRVGEEMEITGPSVAADDLTWWPVRYLSATGAQVDGWVAEVARDGDPLLGVVE